jgi:hypothetical protein
MERKTRFIEESSAAAEVHGHDPALVPFWATAATMRSRHTAHCMLQQPRDLLRGVLRHAMLYAVLRQALEV